MRASRMVHELSGTTASCEASESRAVVAGSRTDTHARTPLRLYASHVLDVPGLRTLAVEIATALLNGKHPLFRSTLSLHFLKHSGHPDDVSTGDQTSQ